MSIPTTISMTISKCSQRLFAAPSLRVQLRGLLMLLTLLPLGVYADDRQSKTFGDYVVHYNVFNSTFISPENAARYGITRAKNRALINIAVRKNLAKGEDKAQRAIVSGSSSDLIHRLELDFKEIVEQDAIYYIAELKFSDKELRTYRIKIQPNPNIAAYTLKFTQTLYHD